MNCEDGEVFIPALKTFIVNELLDGHDEDFDEFTPLLEWGIIDSISMARLLAFVQAQFRLEVRQSAVTAANVVNLAAFASYLARIRRSVTVAQARDAGQRDAGSAVAQEGCPHRPPPINTHPDLAPRTSTWTLLI